MECRTMRLFSLGIILLGLILSGCATTNPLPIAARAGDTITLAVGSPEGMTSEPSNTTVEFTPNGTTETFDLPIKSVVKVFPDKESPTMVNNSSSQMPVLAHYTSHEPWLTLIVLDLPTNLPVGAGIIKVNTIADYGAAFLSINGKDIHFTVLDGTGSYHPLEYHTYTPIIGNLADVEKSHRIKFALSLDGQGFAAVEYRLQFAPGELPSEFDLIPGDMQFMTESMRNVSWTVSGEELLVVFTSLTGNLARRDLQFSIIPEPAAPMSAGMPSNMPNDPPTLTSVQYFNTEGEVMQGPDETAYSIVIE